MLITTTIADLFWIAHFPGPAIKGFIFYFHKNFLPEKTLKNLQVLPIFQNDGRALYLLNQQQNQQVAGILEKLMKEKNSDYVFSKDLMRTYLIELIHCIVKIHQKKIACDPLLGEC